MTTQDSGGKSLADAFLNPVMNFFGETLEQGKEYVWSQWFEKDPQVVATAQPSNNNATGAERYASQSAGLPFGLTPTSLGMIAVSAAVLILVFKD